MLVRAKCSINSGKHNVGEQFELPDSEALYLEKRGAVEILKEQPVLKQLIVTEEVKAPVVEEIQPIKKEKVKKLKG